jgi:hypothetical protein
MVNDLIVVAGATHREGFIDEYEQQLANAGIQFHLEPLSDLPGGANSITIRRRLAYMRAMCDKFSDYERIVMTDAWDVLFFGTKEEVLEKVPSTGLLVSTERNCYPEPGLAPQFTSASPWRFMNNGMLCGVPGEILKWCGEADGHGDMNILDQAWFNRARAKKSPWFGADEHTMIFYVVSATQEDGALQVKHGRPWNTRYDSFPNFIHFSGKCPSEGVRAMIKENQ